NGRGNSLAWLMARTIRQSLAGVLVHCSGSNGARHAGRGQDMSGNGASARGVKQVGYFDCAGGGQVVVDGRVAYVAHMKAPHGTTIVDVSDPANPRQLASIEVPPGTHSHKVRAGNGLMLVNREAHGQPSGASAPRGLGIYDVS